MSRSLRLLRLLHTEGRQIPHAPQGGAAILPAPPPSESPQVDPNPSPSTEAPAKTSPPAVPQPGDDRRRALRRAMTRIGSRPPRTTRVTLPSGQWEPPSYPPPVIYEKEEPGKVHPLWHFFKVPSESMSWVGEETQDPPDFGSLWSLKSMRSASKGRSWLASELRTKSFADLHTLWYILLRERNTLVTQEDERRRLGVQDGNQRMRDRKRLCRKSMAGIKYVLNERRLALIASELPHTLPQHLAQRDLPLWADPSRSQLALRGDVPIPEGFLADLPLPGTAVKKRSGRSPAGTGSDGGEASAAAAGLGEAALATALTNEAAQNESDDEEDLDEEDGYEDEGQENEGAFEQYEGEEDGLKQEEQDVGEDESAVGEEDVSEREVDARDEGFGGGEEAEEFVDDVEVDDDGHVKKRDS